MLGESKRNRQGCVYAETGWENKECVALLHWMRYKAESKETNLYLFTQDGTR